MTTKAKERKLLRQLPAAARRLDFTTLMGATLTFQREMNRRIDRWKADPDVFREEADDLQDVALEKLAGVWEAELEESPAWERPERLEELVNAAYCEIATRGLEA